MGPDKAREKLALARQWLEAGKAGPALGAAVHGELLARDLVGPEAQTLAAECEAVARQANARIGRQPALQMGA